MWQTSAAWLREAQGMLLGRSTPGGCQAVSLPKARGAGRELPTSGACPSPPPGMYPSRAQIQAAADSQIAQPPIY